MKPDQIMREYEAAYTAATGKTLQIDYFGGWYSVYSNNFQSKYRGKEIVEMTERLRKRAIAFVRDGAGEPIFGAAACGANATGNAYMASAAPDLYEALLIARGVMEVAQSVVKVAGIREAIQLAVVAIAKAEGRT